MRSVTTPTMGRLREVLELATLHPELGETGIRRAMHVSRATYYRLLREARERFAERSGGAAM